MYDNEMFTHASDNSSADPSEPLCTVENPTCAGKSPVRAYAQMMSLLIERSQSSPAARCLCQLGVNPNADRRNEVNNRARTCEPYAPCDQGQERIFLPTEIIGSQIACWNLCRAMNRD